MTMAMTMTTMSRRDTGQLLSENTRSLGKLARKCASETVAWPAGTSGLLIVLPSQVHAFFEMFEIRK
jgi:hypothetical protein